MLLLLVFSLSLSLSPPMPRLWTMILLPRSCIVVVARALVSVARPRITPRLALLLPEPTSLEGRQATGGQGKGGRDMYNTMGTHQQLHQVRILNI